jgi:hypothetical protein
VNHQAAKTSTDAGLALVANGSSGEWDVAVDGLPDTRECLLEIDGPQCYLAFQLQDLAVVSKAAHFLDAVRSAPPERKWSEADDTLAIGRFGSATVSLVRDNEGPPRCFLVIGRSPARSSMRLNIDAADIESLLDALRQVEQDIEP